MQQAHTVAQSPTITQDRGVVEMNQEKKFASNGVDYYNIDNKLIIKDNKENIARNISSRLTEANASLNLSSSQEVAKPESISEIQAPTPPSDLTVVRMITQLFYNDNSTQKHKLKVRLNHTDKTNTEWIATLNKDARVFRKHNDLELARGWISRTRQVFSTEQGYKQPYLGKFHCHKDARGPVPGNLKEPGCFASVAYNTHDESWYAMIAIYDWIGIYEYDYNYTKKQKQQGVKAQLVYTNPKLYAQRGGETWAQRNGLA